MATFKCFVIFTAAVLCCLVVQYIDATTTGPTTGALQQPCSDIPWNETFLDKVYYIQHSEDPTTYTFTNVNNKCNGIAIQKLVVDSLAENDFIVEMMKKYQPDIESKVFLACPSDTRLSISFRRFNCRESEAFYKEETHSSQGFWNWRGGEPTIESGTCVLLDTVDGAWSVSNCGYFSNFVICQCRRGIPAGTYVSTRFHERSFGSRTCLKSELTMRMVSVDNFIKCAMECQSDGHCASFNLRNQDGITSPLICQLSLYHSSIVPDTKFIRDRNCKYYERVR